MQRTAALLLLTGTLGGAFSCERSSPAQHTVGPPVIPAGFVEQRGEGWRLALPSAWQEAPDAGPGIWVAVDPQPVNDYRANVSVVSEPFPGESRDYAKASEALLRRQPGASVEGGRETVVDGDPTLIVEARWLPNAPPSVEYRTMQTHLASRGTGYVITCSVSVAAFERYRPTCEAIVQSLAVER
jgi:hypothetical protein